jgi:hypothetical protein
MTLSRTRGSPVRLQIFAAALVGCVFFAPTHVARAQGGAGSEPAAPDSAASTESRGSEETRARVAEIEAEIARVETFGGEWVARTAQFEQARRGAPEALAAIDAEVAELKGRETPGIDPELPLAELEVELLGQEQDLELARREASEVDAEASGRAERRKQTPELMAVTKERRRSTRKKPCARSSSPPGCDRRR